LLAGVACSVALGACFSEGARDRGSVAEGGERSPWFIEPEAPLPIDSTEPTPEPLQAIRVNEGGDIPVLEPLAVTELGALFPASAALVGVALVPGSDRPYVLDARAGLYELTGDGAKLVFDLPASRVLGGSADGAPPAELTDVAFDIWRFQAEGTLGFALTAENDGFLLSLPSGSLTSHFCYLPPATDWVTTSTPSVSQELREQGIQVAERTEAVAVSDLSGQIFAQPRTVRMDGAGVAGSELFLFDTGGGQPVGTRRFERIDFVAGGAAFLGQLALVLGSGDGLYVTLGWADDVQRVATLSGVREITGIATLPSGNLLVLDGPNERLLEVDALDLNASAARLGL